MKKFTLLALTIILCTGSIIAGGGKDDDKKTKSEAPIFAGLKFRNIGPALTSGRISDIAVNPNNPYEFYITAASGGVWKTSNSGNTFTPIFDKQGSYSIGCVALDPNNPNVVWIGTGENNNQRSVGYGDGLYRSKDGGKTWKNVGLKTSEHIGKIVVDPNNSNTIYVASMGPLWKEGGERGVYKSTDGGETWKRVLNIDKHTGFTDIIIDPNHTNILYASAQQRRRHVFTYIGGGPGSGIHKSEDGGTTWKKLKTGLPSVELGRIGLAISPVNSDYVFAIIEASDKKGGFYRSTNRGESWERRSDYSTSGNYYQEIICDPVNVERIFSMNTWLHHSNDGGKTFVKTGEKSKHVDNHCIWIDPTNTEHWLVGCDGGLYETWDAASNWHYKTNLPLTQFYKVAVDNSEPFYNVYGGTQDNASIGGPSRTINNAGIVTADWYITKGGDGFESQIDPKDPNIIYSQSQYGHLARFDKKSGQRVVIQPTPGEGEKGYRWNWDAPLLISPHNHKRLYFAANKVFRSDDRGNSWTTISDDLCTQKDRNKLKVMDRIWSMDAVMKNKSTTMYGNIVALDESPKQENLIYAGTDDGLIHVSEDAGTTWRKVDPIPGVPENTYVNNIICSKHDANTVFAVFNNHKRGDFKPYIYISTDKGLTWKAIQNDLPERGSVYDLAQDFKNPSLLFAGTEFGCFFSYNAGKNWIQLKNGLPTVAIRDIEIQERESDLVLASFGRGFFVLDNYDPLRSYTKELWKTPAHIFPIKDALMFVESSPLGTRGKSSYGESFFTSPNPKTGATFTYLLSDTLRTIKQIRQSAEKKVAKNGGDNHYPSIEMMIKEDNEEKPYLLFTIRDKDNVIIRKIKTDPKNGINRLVWDCRHTPTTPLRLKPKAVGRYSDPDEGPIALPGLYTVSLSASVNGLITELVPPTPFKVKSLQNTTLPANDAAELLAFQTKVGNLRRATRAAGMVKHETDKRLKIIKVAIQSYPTVPYELMTELKSIEEEQRLIAVELTGNPTLSKRDMEQSPDIIGRVEEIVWSMWSCTSAPTKSNEQAYQIAGKQFEPILNRIKIAEEKVTALEGKMDQFKVPYTQGRMPLPDWKMD